MANTKTDSPGERRAGSWTYRWEGFVFNAVCGLYFIFLAPFVVDAAGIAMRDPEGKVIWLGILLIAISLGEVYAFPTKMRFVNRAIRDRGDFGGKALYLWLFHAVISIIILFVIAGSFGIKVTGAEDGPPMPGWLAGMMVVVVIKELVFLGFLWSGSEPDGAPNPKYVRPSFREWIANTILLAYASVAYSATWSTITKGLDLEWGNPVMFVVNLFVATLLFLIFYLPLRIPYWIEELAQAKTGRDIFRLVASILVVLVPALAN